MGNRLSFSSSLPASVSHAKVVLLLRPPAATAMDALQKAEALIEALNYIRTFRGCRTVVKLGGSAMEDPAALHATLTMSCSWRRSACGRSWSMAAANRSTGRWPPPA